ncbi:MAG: TlpA family protein disulfide reductase [Oligoflexales bacterium]
MKFLAIIVLLINVGTAFAENHGESENPQDKLNKEYDITDTYTHKWIKFPEFSAQDVQTEQTVDFKHKWGEATVVVFLASWCLPCQQLIKELMRIEKKYQKNYTKFIYVFSHDTREDALGFRKTYNLKGLSILSTGELLNAFHQPELPSIYVADRYGWLVTRYLDTNFEHLKDLDKFLYLHTTL